MKDVTKLSNLVGKTIKDIHMSDAHGDVLVFTFTDGTVAHISSYEKPKPTDEMAVFYNGEEL